MPEDKFDRAATNAFARQIEKPGTKAAIERINQTADKASALAQSLREKREKSQLGLQDLLNLLLHRKK